VGTMKRDYEQTASGAVANEADSHQHRVLTYADGVRLEVHVQGSQMVGLPTQFDKDYLFGLLRLAAEGRVRPDGSFIDPSYRDILRATGRPEGAGKLRFDAVKRALSRFAGLVLTTNADIDYTAAAAAVRDGSAAPLLPEGRPKRRTLEAKHWVLEYDVESQERADGQHRDIIRHLRLNPLWLAHVDAGVATWLDVDVHNRLASEWAKRIYQVLAIRVVRGWRAQMPHVVSLDDFLVELGVDTGRERGKLAENVRSALATLAAAGVVAEGNVTRVGHGRYEVTIFPGERLLLAGLLRGAPPDAPTATHMLLSHMRAYGISVEQGRRYLAERPGYVREVLAFAHYLQSERRGYHGAKRIDNWNAWVYRALESGAYEFEDSGFTAGVDAQASRVLADGATINATPGSANDGVDASPAPSSGLARRATSVAAPRRSRRATPPASPPPPVETPRLATAVPALALPDDLWGRALAAVQDQVRPAALFGTYLASAQLERVDGDVVVVRAIDDFHAEKLVRTWGAELCTRLSAELGRPMTLVAGRFRCEGRTPAGPDASAGRGREPGLEAG
ncbi:MAG TPA: hypothetical protein VGD56_18125, partial [Gemmatirosa sp.]